MNRATRPLDAESREGVSGWIGLKGHRAHQRIVENTGAPSPTMLRRVGAVLDFLGFPYQDEAQLSLRDSGRMNSWARLSFECDPNDGLKGIPLFGSQAEGRYDVFCLWDARPNRIWSISDISQISGGGQSAVILLYLGALTSSERNDVKRRSWDDNLTVAIVDEMLMEVLARYERDDRFQAFLQAALPYSAYNPYNSVTAGWGARVPPEMFYGREKAAQDIQRMREGSCVIFGGRQLGKTSLLRHAQNQRHKPEEDRHAWFIDLKDRGYVADGDKSPEDVWEDVLKEFAHNGLSVPEESDGDARRAVARLLQNNPRLEVLILFDESDSFLEKDAALGFPVIESMRVMMGDSNNRFKAVFAGLHSVQRFAHKPNSPFANLGFDAGAPRRGGIGPLAYRDARKLVEEPFHALGFRFEDLAVDRILTYTHCHPSLTQFFCHRLIQTFREENRDASPPFIIRSEDVDRVNGMSEIQNGIKRRFEETFKLDPRYHAICLATLLDHLQNATQKWTIKDVSKLCGMWRSFESDAMPDADLKSLLDELIGLGVLIEDGSSYRIRSRLIARMFGAKSEDIEHGIDEIELD